MKVFLSSNSNPKQVFEAINDSTRRSFRKKASTSFALRLHAQRSHSWRRNLFKCERTTKSVFLLEKLGIERFPVEGPKFESI